MARRIGFYSIRKFAYSLCKYVLRYGPIIRELYPEATALHAALEAASAACGVLVQEIDATAPAGV